MEAQLKLSLSPQKASVVTQEWYADYQKRMCSALVRAGLHFFGFENIPNPLRNCFVRVEKDKQVYFEGVYVVSSAKAEIVEATVERELKKFKLIADFKLASEGPMSDLPPSEKLEAVTVKAPIKPPVEPGPATLKTRDFRGGHDSGNLIIHLPSKDGSRPITYEVAVSSEQKEVIIPDHTAEPAFIKKKMYSWLRNWGALCNKREAKNGNVKRDKVENDNWPNINFRREVLRHLLDEVLPKDMVTPERLPEILTRSFLNKIGLSGLYDNGRYNGHGNYIDLLLELGYITPMGAEYMRDSKFNGYTGRKPPFEPWMKERAQLSERSAPASAAEPAR